MSPLSFRPCAADASPARELLAAVLAEYEIMIGPDPSGAPPMGSAQFAPPGGVYLVGYVEGEPACGGGLRRLTAETGEIKRLYVAPSFRRQGVGSALLLALEAAAVELGYRRVRLDSHPGAAAIYVGAGYVPIADYNGNPYAVFWGEKLLAAAAPEGLAPPAGPVVGTRRPASPGG